MLDLGYFSKKRDWVRKNLGTPKNREGINTYDTYYNITNNWNQRQRKKHILQIQSRRHNTIHQYAKHQRNTHNRIPTINRTNIQTIHRPRNRIPPNNNRTGKRKH